MNLKSCRNNRIKSDEFISVEYYPLSKKNPKTVELVDKNLNTKNKSELGHRSIFNYQDFRNNVVFEEERKQNDNLVNKKPRKFFDWDDRKVFNAKTKKDI